jgi:hypothetical protein
LMDPLDHFLGVFLLSGREGLIDLLDHFVGFLLGGGGG